jgi:hypothetical protein
VPEEPFYDDVMPLAQYAESIGKSERQVQRDARLGRIPTWTDPSVGPGKVTSPKAIAIMRHKRAEQGVAEAMRPETQRKGRKA